MSTYTPIASVTLSSAQSSVTFSNIPQTYTDLVLVTNWASSNSLSFLYIQFNSDTGSNYSFTELYGNGSAAGSYRESNQSIPWVSANVGVPSTIKANTIMNFMNYSNSTTYKTWIARMNSVDAPSYPGTAASVGLWRSTNAITTITLKNRTSGVDYNFASGSTFNLYGIANASINNVAKATGGDSVTTDGTYWYHTFRSSGTFTPTQALTADYLVVAGGGGGGAAQAGVYDGGGGGAGGLRCTVTATGGGGSLESALSLTTQAYTVTVGAGGAAGASGSNSVFSTITSTGGGRGSAGTGTLAQTGGSGGGSDNGNPGAAGTANQGFAGSSNGGGGGAGEVGGTDAVGEGGDGVATSISGTSVTYAGGGGAGGGGKAGGTGGGGAGNNNGVGTAGTANTGGGGGGSRAVSGSFAGSAGGSGIVIVRYAV